MTSHQTFDFVGVKSKILEEFKLLTASIKRFAVLILLARYILMI